jgi:pyruvate dehydrogenase E2 component (dihydrolipoamide acetyltransferase)
VNEKDDLVEITTDKATFNLPSPCSGMLSEIFFREGDSVNIGEMLAIIEE